MLLSRVKGFPAAALPSVLSGVGVCMPIYPPRHSPLEQGDRRKDKRCTDTESNPVPSMNEDVKAKGRRHRQQALLTHQTIDTTV